MGFGGQYGYYTDRETGLVLMGHRYYDPGTGRFLTRDPSGYGGGMNLYGYADGNPVNESDPSGFAPDPDDPTGLPGDNDGHWGMTTSTPGSHEGFKHGTPQNNARRSMTKGLCEMVREAVIAGATGAIGLFGESAVAGSAAARSRVVRVRHYTDPEGIAGIRADGAINPMRRGGTPGVHVEVGPNFGPLGTAQRETGAAIRAGRPTKYVEFNAPAGIIDTTGRVGPRRTGIIPTHVPLSINHLKPKYGPAWWEFWHWKL